MQIVESGFSENHPMHLFLLNVCISFMYDLFHLDRHLELVECTEDEALSYCVQLLVNSLKVTDKLPQAVCAFLRSMYCSIALDGYMDKRQKCNANNFESANDTKLSIISNESTVYC
jgi:hypothetical protein